MLRTFWLRTSAARSQRHPRRQPAGRDRRLLLRLEPLEERALMAATINPFVGDVIGAVSRTALLNPAGVAIDKSGNVYIADTDNNKVLKVTGGAVTVFAGGGP